MCALPPKADMCGATRDVRFGPKADIEDLRDLRTVRGRPDLGECTRLGIAVLFHDVYQFNGVFRLERNRYFSRTEFLKIAIGSRYSKIEKAYRLIRNSRLIHTIRADTVARSSAR